MRVLGIYLHVQQASNPFKTSLVIIFNKTLYFQLSLQKKRTFILPFDKETLIFDNELYIIVAEIGYFIVQFMGFALW